MGKQLRVPVKVTVDREGVFISIAPVIGLSDLLDAIAKLFMWQIDGSTNTSHLGDMFMYWNSLSGISLELINENIKPWQIAQEAAKLVAAAMVKTDMAVDHASAYRAMQLRLFVNGRHRKVISRNVMKDLRRFPEQAA